MANWYYYDSSNQRQGLITDAELKSLSAQGIITPETSLETESGHKGRAGQIKGLFPEPAVNPFASPPQQQPLYQQPMIYCSACGNQVLASAFVCPKCGTKVTKPGGGGGSGQGSDFFSPNPNMPLRSRTIYIVLALFLGGFGVHNWWAGRKKEALIQTCIGISAAIFIVPIFVSCVWGWVNIFNVKEDGLGRPFV